MDRKATEFPRGWLRVEIGRSVRAMLRKDCVPEDVKADMRRSLRVIEETDALERAEECRPFQMR